jgi:hypothetical protein
MYLLNPRYVEVLTEEERTLAETYRDLAVKLEGMGSPAPSWGLIREWLAGLGYSSEGRYPARS